MCFAFILVISLVLASYGNDGSRQILDDFREAYYWLWQVSTDTEKQIDREKDSWTYIVCQIDREINEMLRID